LGFKFADVRLRPHVIVGVATGVAKEIGWTPFPESSDSVHGGLPIRPGAAKIASQPVSVATVGIHERERSETSVGRPGLDPGTLRVFPERPWTSVSVQICWPEEVQCPLTSADVLSRLNSWLDSWLDPGSLQGQVTIQFRGVDGEVFDLQLGDEYSISQTIL